MKFILRMLLVLTTTVPVAAAGLPNRLAWIDGSSDTVNELKNLYLMQGFALPSSSGPLSLEELFFILEKIDRTVLQPVQSRMVTLIERDLNPLPDYLEDALFAADTSLKFAVEGLAANGNPVNRIWDKSWTSRKAMVDWINKFWMTPFAYTEFHIDARHDPLSVMDQRGPFSSNILTGLDQLDGFFPSTGYISFGVPHLELKWGRGKISWGQGVTGNLLFSDAAGLHDQLSFTTYWDWFKMQLLYLDMDSYTLERNKTLLPDGSEPYRSAFTDNQGNVYLPGLAESNTFGFLKVAGSDKGDSAMDVSRRLVSHRFEFRLPGNFNLHITEALLFTSTTLELRHLMPMFIYHNWFQQWNANPNFTIEAEWTPFRGFGFYTVILGDYVTTTFKDDWYQDPHPLAMGYQIGMKTAHTMGEGILSTVLEGVFIDPYTYLDEAVDWISMRRILTNYQNFVSIAGYAQPQVMIIDSPLGYHLGPDSAAGLLKVSYTVPGAWKATLDLEGQLKGLVTLRSLHPLLTNSSEMDQSNLLADQNAALKTLFGADSMKSIVVRLEGEINPAYFNSAIPENLELSLGLVAKIIENGLDPFRTRDPLKPLKGNNYVDFQGFFGISWVW